MNCKQGDLAVIVRSMAGNEGKIVRCDRLIPGGEDITGLPTEFGGVRWVIGIPMMGTIGPIYSVADSCLRPLRDSDGEDEVLRYAGRPVGAQQAA